MEVPYQDVEFLRNWSRTVLLFAKGRAQESGEDASIFDRWIAIDESPSLTLRQLRSSFHDVREFAGGFSEDDKAKLTEILEAKFGVGSAVFKKVR